MATESNKELLLRIDKKVDDIQLEMSKMQLDVALKFSNMKNANDKRFTKFESYLKSDPDTNQMGAIEKLAKVDKRVSTLETKATIYGTVGGMVVLAAKWVISVFF
jgi:hypothetical protein